MRLEDFIEEQKRLLDEFKQHWVVKHASEEVENYPLDLPPGDWDEQFHLWNGDPTK
jgi:hypothetical protein